MRRPATTSGVPPTRARSHSACAADLAANGRSRPASRELMTGRTRTPMSTAGEAHQYSEDEGKDRLQHPDRRARLATLGRVPPSRDR